MIILQMFHKWSELQHHLSNCGFVDISVTYYMENKAQICWNQTEKQTNKQPTGKAMGIEVTPGCMC